MSAGSGGQCQAEQKQGMLRLAHGLYPLPRSVFRSGEGEGEHATGRVGNDESSANFRRDRSEESPCQRPCGRALRKGRCRRQTCHPAAPFSARSERKRKQHWASDFVQTSHCPFPAGERGAPDMERGSIGCMKPGRSFPEISLKPRPGTPRQCNRRRWRRWQCLLHPPPLQAARGSFGSPAKR